ncbi:hypothetical protein AB4369_23790, partial [Vibrio sp. 10N.261.49.A5]|uniref:hypothetical protein n=1 Tax=Vibrio sp. 10N.261.49.A5 TaxID=3229670 RepID=UPI00354B3115
VSYLLFRLTHVVTALTIIKDQIAGLEKGSIDLGNNALEELCLLSLTPVVFEICPSNFFKNPSTFKPEKKARI